MKKNDLFITEAMLASYLSVEHKNYLELIEPFVLNCLPDEIDAVINIEQLQEKINSDYNMEILYNVVEKILQRLSKQKHGEYIKRQNHNYYLNKVYDDTKFNDRKVKIKNSLEQVVRSLKSFLEKEKKLNKVTENDAKEYLSVFLDAYNYSIYDNVESANNITINAQNKTNYYVAQFILNEYNKNSIVYDSVLEIIKGTLVAKSIYYFMFEENNEYCNKLNGTMFYLDTRLLIGLLGINSEQEYRAMNELTSLITTNGGKLATFSHYIDELRGILYKYSKDINSRFSLSLQKFSSTNMSSLDVDIFSKTLESRIEALGVSIEELPDYEQMVDSQKWHIDYNELNNALNSSINYKTNYNSYSDSLENDCNTIEAVSYMRGDRRKCSIHNCNAIFVTKNIDIVKVVNTLYYRERFSKGEINFVISDVDLTAMLWLSSFGCKSDLPQLKLLEDVYAACAPSKNVMKAFLNKIKSLEDSEKISQETAILLRTDYSMLDDLTELTENNSDRITDEIIYEMQARLANREKKKAIIEANEKLKTEMDKLEEEKQLNYKETIDVERKRNELIQMQRRVSKETQDMQVIANRLERQRIKNEKDSVSNANEIKKIEDYKKKVIERIKKKAKVASSVVYGIMNIIIWILCLAIIGFFAYATYEITDFNIKSKIVCYIFIGAVSIIGFAVSIFSYKKSISKWIAMLSEKVYDYIYAQEVQKDSDILFD